MVETRRTDLVLLVVALVWGSSYLTAKAATDTLPVLVVLFMRYLISAVVCVPLVLATARRAHGQGRWTPREIRVGSVLGLTQAAVLLVEMYGVAHTTAANAGLLISLTLVLTPLLDQLGGRNTGRGTQGGPGGGGGTGQGGGGGRLPARFFLAAGMCVVAVGLLTSGHGLHAPGTGDALMLGAAVIRAGHVVLVGRLTAGRSLRPLQLTSVQTVVGTVLCLAPAVWIPGSMAGPGGAGDHGAFGNLTTLTHASAATWAELLHLALFCSMFAFLAQTWAVQRTSAGRASLLLGTEPVWALAVGIGLGGERLTVMAALGVPLMLAGTYWGQAVERAHRSGVLGGGGRKRGTEEETGTGTGTGTGAASGTGPGTGSEARPVVRRPATAAATSAAPRPGDPATARSGPDTVPAAASTPARLTADRADARSAP